MGLEIYCGSDWSVTIRGDDSIETSNAKLDFAFEMMYKDELSKKSPDKPNNSERDYSSKENN